MSIFSGSDKTVVGLDIGSHSVKLVQLRKKGSGWDMVSLRSALLPPGAIVEGRIMNSTAVIHCLRDLAQQAGVEGAKCALSISGSYTIVKKLSLPEMTRAQLDDSITWEAEQYIPFDVKDVSVDSQILNPRAGQSQMDVLMVAAKKDVVNEYVTCATEAGFRVVIIDLAIFAATNTLIMNGYAPTDQTVAFLNVGANSINVGVLFNGQLAFTRDLPYGSAMLTAEIQKQYNVSFEEAEKFKIFGSDELNRDLQSIAERVADSWITEIQRSLDFFVATRIYEDFQRILLMGGGCLCPALIRELEKRLECPVEVVNPFRQIGIDQSKFNVDELTRDATSAAVAVGLATRAVDDYLLDDSAPGLRINFLPKPPIKKLWHQAISRSWPAYRGPKRIPRAGHRGKPTDQSSQPISLLSRLLAIILLLAIVAFGVLAILEMTEEFKQIQAPAPAPATAPIVKCECVCPGAPPFVTDPTPSKGDTF